MSMPSIFAWVSEGPLGHSACAVESCKVKEGETTAWNLIPARALRKPSHEPRPGVGD